MTTQGSRAPGLVPARRWQHEAREEDGGRPGADVGLAAADDDGRGRRRRRVADHRVAGAEQHRRGAAVGLDPPAGARRGARARLHPVAATRRRGSPRSARPTIGFVADEITTDPWCAMQLEAVRAKAWEHGLTVTAGVSHGDPELEAALLERMLRRAAGRADLRLDPDPPDPPARGLRPHADGAAQLLRARPQPRLGGAGRAARRLRRDAAPDPRRPPPHRPHPRPVLDRPGARPHPRLPPGAGRARHPLRPGAGPARQLGAADRLPAHRGADGPARPADGDLPLQRHDGGRRLRRAEGARACAFRRTSRWSATTTARSPSSCARR